MTIVKEQIIKVQKVFWHLLFDFWVFWTLDDVENKTFKKKKATFPVKKKFWPFYSRIIECDKLHGTIYKVPKGIVTLTVEVIGLVL